MTLSITEDIRSITDLKRNTNSVLEQIHKTKCPVVLTVNGKASAVLLAAKEYEKIVSAFNLLKLLMPAEEDIKNDRYKEARDFFKGFKRDKKIYLLEAFPDRNPLIPENEFFGTNYRHLIHKKYRIVYRMAEKSVYILRIFQGVKLLNL
jgi:prevent-host-death family protein